ncbi:MAG: CHAT domain-containing tetratricopeptide repeat protein [Actinomycetota bacterium]
MSQKKFLFLLAIFLVFTNLKVFAFNSNETTPLKLNVPVAQDFKNDEQYFYSIKAQEKEIVEIICEQKGVDIELAAFAPNGEKLSVTNAPTGFVGRETLVFIAKESGNYQIELKSSRPGNIAGSYTILFNDEHLANKTDLLRSAAMKLSGESRESLSGAENRLEKSAQALEKLEKALTIFEKIDDLPGQANILFHLGYINGNEFGDKAKALEFYEKALEIWSKIADEAGKAICLTHLADEMRDYDNSEKDRSYYVNKSLDYFNEALLIDRKLNSKSDEAVALSFLCRLYNDTGSFQKGFEACRESLRIEENNDPLTDYRSYTNLASLYNNSGDSEKALKYNQMALERISIVKDYLNPIRYAFVKSNIGAILAAQKRYTEAEQVLQEALSITEQIKRPLYSGYILVRLSNISYETDKFQEALEYATKGVAFYREIDPAKRQFALNALGKSYFALGQIDEARKLFTEAVELNRQNKDRYAEAESLYNLAQLENQVGNIETARQSIGQAINNSEIIRAQLLGKNQRTSYLVILKKYYELEIELLIKLHEKTADPIFLEQAWQKHEKIRARSLLENLIESGLNINEIAPENFFVQAQTLLEAIANAELKRADALKTKNPVLQKEAEADLHKNLDEYQILQEKVRQLNPQFSAINQPQDPSITDAEKLIEADTAILEFALGEKESYVWVIRKDSFKLVKLASKAVINQTAREFYLALTDRRAKNDKTIIEKSQNLSRAVLQPLAGEIQNIKQLIIIADGSLQLIPFSALTLSPDTAYQPLATTVEIANAPSFSSLIFLCENKANRQPSADKLLAIFADPIFQDDDERLALNKTTNPKTPQNRAQLSENLSQVLRDFGLERLARLPFSGIEAREIGKFAPQQTFLALGANASRQNFLRGDFNSYRILHFATHGFLDQQNPDLSGLVLSLYDEKRTPQNGFLRVIDLYSLHLNADLVVLSACQTGLGKETDGEGIVGLTSGFMFAGASGVVSSLWKVEDAATAELMKRFYRAMLKENQTPSAALRIAQNELRQIPRFRNPNNWAGFILTGEWR